MITLEIPEILRKVNLKEEYEISYTIFTFDFLRFISVKSISNIAYIDGKLPTKRFYIMCSYSYMFMCLVILNMNNSVCVFCCKKMKESKSDCPEYHVLFF